MLPRRLRFQLIMAIASMCLAIAVVATFIAYTIYQESKFNQDVGLETTGDVDAGR